MRLGIGFPFSLILLELPFETSFLGGGRHQDLIPGAPEKKGGPEALPPSLRAWLLLLSFLSFFSFRCLILVDKSGRGWRVLVFRPGAFVISVGPPVVFISGAFFKSTWTSPRPQTRIPSLPRLQ